MDVQTTAVENTRKSFEELNGSITTVSESIKDIDLLNKNMIGVKDKTEKVVHGLSNKAKENIAATENMSAITEEQLAIITSIIDTMDYLGKSAEVLNEELSVIKTKEDNV